MLWQCNEINEHHLALLCHLFDVSYNLLLLLFHVLALTVKVAHRLVQRSLVLSQHLLRRFPASEEKRHDEVDLKQLQSR